MELHEALTRARKLLDNHGYERVELSPQNFLQYNDFVIDVLKDSSKPTLRKYEDDGWLWPFLEAWKELRGDFEHLLKRDPGMAYVPAHRVSEEFHASLAHTRFYQAGNRTSKTQSGYLEDYWFATGTHPYRSPTPAIPGAVCILTGLPLKDYAPKVFELKMLTGEPDNPYAPLFPEGGKWFNHYDSRKHILKLGCPECAAQGKSLQCPNSHAKSTIYLISSEQDLTVLEAFQAGLMHIDEHIPKEYYQASKQRISSVAHSCMIVTGTPLAGPNSWEQQLLVPLAKAGTPYDPEDPNSPPAVSLHEISQFDAGLVPKAKLLNDMKTMDYFEIQARIYGRPAAITDSPVFNRIALTEIREAYVQEAEFGQLALRENVTIEDLLFAREVEWVPATEHNATPDNDGNNDIYTGIRVWEHPQEDGEYVVAADVAEGLAGSDRSCASVLKVTYKNDNLKYPIVEKVAEFYGLLNISHYADEIKKLATYYRSALVVVERTGIGLGVMERLRINITYHNLYRDKTQPDQANIDISNVYGLSTNATTKPKMVGFTQKLILDRRLIIHCEGTFSELVAYEQYRGEGEVNTKYRGASGSRDDRTMSLCLGAYAIVTAQAPFFSLPLEDTSSFDNSEENLYNETAMINAVAESILYGR